MKTPISGRSNTLPQTQPLQEHTPVQGSPSAPAGSTGNIPEGTQRDMPDRTSVQGASRRPAWATAQQLLRRSTTVEGQDTTAGSQAKVSGAKRTREQAQFPDDVGPRRDQPTPQESMNTDMSESDQLLQELEQALSPEDEQTLNDLLTDEATAASANVAGPVPEQEPMDADTLNEADQVLEFLEQGWHPEDEQTLNGMLIQGAFAPPAAAHVAGPVPQQAPMDTDSESISTGISYAGVNLNQLQSLGYTKKQASAIKPENRSEVIKHHQNLTEKGFDLAQICAISKRGPSLGFLTKEYGALMRSLPDLTQKDVVAIAKGRSGNLALEALLRVAPDLKAGPLQLSTDQLAKIAKEGERPALQAVHSLGLELLAAPYKLSSE